MLLTNRLAKQLNRRTVSGFYGDTALLLISVDSGAVDEYNNPVVTTSEIPILCSYTELTAAEQFKNYGDLGIVEAEIRFDEPRPHKGDHIQVLSRFSGVPVSGEILEIVSIVDRADLGYKCALHKAAV